MKNEKANELAKSMTDTMMESITFIRNVISNIIKIYGTANGLFIQSFDRSLFGNKTQDEISDQIYGILMKEYSIMLSTPIVVVDKDFVVVVGYADKIEFMTRKEAEYLC